MEIYKIKNVLEWSIPILGLLIAGATLGLHRVNSLISEREKMISIDKYDKQLIHSFERIEPYFHPVMYRFNNTNLDTTLRINIMEDALDNTIKEMEGQSENPVLESNEFVGEIWRNFLDSTKEAKRMINSPDGHSYDNLWMAGVGHIGGFHSTLGMYLQANGRSFIPKRDESGKVITHQ